MMCDKMNWDLELFFNEYVGIDGTSIDDLIDDLAQIVGFHQSDELQGAEDFVQHSDINIVLQMHDLHPEKHQTTECSAVWNKAPISIAHHHILDFQTVETGSWYVGIDGELYSDSHLDTDSSVISVRSDLYPEAIRINEYSGREQQPNMHSTNFYANYERVQESPKNLQKIHGCPYLSAYWTSTQRTEDLYRNTHNFVRMPENITKFEDTFGEAHIEQTSNSLPMLGHQHNQQKRKNTHLEIAENAKKRSKLTSDFYLMRDELINGSSHPFFNS